MAPAFVTGPFIARSSFAGRSLPACAPIRPTVTMSASPVSRRDALLAGAALLAGIPAAAFAKGGDSPKISVFGVGGASSPFDSGIQTGGSVQYKAFAPDEVAVFKRIIEESKQRLEGASDSIKIKSWEDVRSRIRLEASDLRKTQLTINANIDDQQLGAAAAKAYQLFKNDLEKLDQAAVQKNQDRAYKAYNAAVKSLTAWQAATGF